MDVSDNAPRLESARIQTAIASKLTPAVDSVMVSAWKPRIFRKKLSITPTLQTTEIG